MKGAGSIYPACTFYITHILSMGNNFLGLYKVKILYSPAEKIPQQVAHLLIAEPSE
ncbi:MAG: hypothetical protein RLZZ417_1907 [Bacteroidota bacterium]|jgi:hypothetical protein